MEMFAQYSEPTVEAQRDAEVVQRFLRGVYGWMCTGLAVTALTAWTVSSSTYLTFELTRFGLLSFLIFAAQASLVLVLTYRVKTLPAHVASVLFVLYSVLVGLTLSTIFISVAPGHLERTFVITAGSFAVLAFYGMATGRDLSG